MGKIIQFTAPPYHPAVKTGRTLCPLCRGVMVTGQVITRVVHVKTGDWFWGHKECVGKENSVSQNDASSAGEDSGATKDSDTVTPVSREKPLKTQ